MHAKKDNIDNLVMRFISSLLSKYSFIFLVFLPVFFFFNIRSKPPLLLRLIKKIIISYDRKYIILFKYILNT